MHVLAKNGLKFILPVRALPCALVDWGGVIAVRDHGVVGKGVDG